MAVDPTFMSFLNTQQPNTASGVTTTTKKNPYAQTATTAPTPGNSPVTATGAVNPNPVPKQASPNQLVTQAQQQPPTPDPFAAMGGGNYNWANGGWTPKNMASGGASGTGTIPNMPSTGTPGGAAGSPGYTQYLDQASAYKGSTFSPYQSMTYNPSQMTVNTPAMYGAYGGAAPTTVLPGQGYMAGNFGTTPFSQYQGNPGNISQYGGVDQSGVENLQQQQLMNMLQNPSSMSAQNVAQLKEIQKEQALELQKSGMSQNAERAAAQGRLGSGSQALQDSLLQDKANNALLTGYRDIDLKKMTQDRADLLDALDTANTAMNSRSNRSTSEFAQTLAGQQAREKVGLDAATSAQAAERLGLERTQAQELANLNQAKSAQELAALGLDKDELAMRDKQFAHTAQSTQFNDALKALGIEMDAAEFNAGENFKGYSSAAQDQKDRFTQELAMAGDAKDVADSGVNLATLKQGAWSDAQARALQEKLGLAGLDVDKMKIGSNEKIAAADNKTRLLDILLGNKFNYAQLGQQGAQFDKSFGLDQQKFGQQQADSDNLLMQWLINNSR